jgi:uncharacterized glyoxalase superfamily protein PhnB
MEREVGLPSAAFQVNIGVASISFNSLASRVFDCRHWSRLLHPKVKLKRGTSSRHSSSKPDSPGFLTTKAFILATEVSETLRRLNNRSGPLKAAEIWEFVRFEKAWPVDSQSAALTRNKLTMPVPAQTTATIIPTLRYHDAHAAIDWLCQTFGFTRHLVVDDGNGGIAHAQLTFGNGMIMVGSAREDEFGRQQVPPTAMGLVTQSPYLVVGDIDRHYNRAVEAGATIVVEIRDEDYGGRFYSCRDPQGQLWNFGDYDPWQADP